MDSFYIFAVLMQHLYRTLGGVPLYINRFYNGVR
jgi:hypothetical protein